MVQQHIAEKYKYMSMSVAHRQKKPSLLLLPSSSSLREVRKELNCLSPCLGSGSEII